MTDKPIRYNFIIPKRQDYTLAQFREGSVDQFNHLYCIGEFCWALQSYFHLKELGLAVSLSNELDPDAVNLAHGNILRHMHKRWDCFCVSLQADFPHYPLAQCHIVQNADQEEHDAFFIPCWPQPGLIKRDSTRDQVINVAYQGVRYFTAIDEDQLNKDLKELGMNFKVLDEAEWHDLRAVDILIGIRCFTGKKYRRKPASKLVNAWIAEIPFIGGCDSAFTQIGLPDVDYLRVDTYEEMLESITRLKTDPDLYRSLVENGRNKSELYSSHAVADRWKQVLENHLATAFLEWENDRPGAGWFRLMVVWYHTDAAIKKVLRWCYRIPAVKYLRDHYYDPVK